MSKSGNYTNLCTGSTGFRSYLPDALRLRFDEQLSVRAIALQLGLNHSTIHNLFQRFNASGITWPLP
ncbi:helix-turn-helix domain-containing protein, partial [Escherichia coli]|uniref:helix-turn-helix domain-containing protein n=1 Tax=Escherichia coli TaxID=562 RepID=UPI002FBDD6C6